MEFVRIAKRDEGEFTTEALCVVFIVVIEMHAFKCFAFNLSNFTAMNVAKSINGALIIDFAFCLKIKTVTVRKYVECIF